MKRALISVADKKNLNIILDKLDKLGYEFISTGTTASCIENYGFKVTKVSDIINFEEILSGRVKTLHPNIHGGILSRRTKEDKEELKKHNIEEIDVVVCNLYPFEEVTANGADIKTAIENIDIGGVTLLRAAAKNHNHVSIICDPDDYYNFDVKNNLEYAVKAFEHTAYYDVLISKYLKQYTDYNSSKLLIAANKDKDLRYGENSHQKASFYITNDNISYSIKNSEILNGKELSYNNIKDIDAALNLISEFDQTTVVALKHNTPCGVGFGDNVLLAYKNCLKMDDVSIFGGIVATNKEITLDLAQELSKLFLEVVIAPKFDKKALKLLKQKKNLRILKTNMDQKSKIDDIVSVNGGFLLQDKDQNDILEEELNIVTKNKSTKENYLMAQKAQIVCKYVKSNAIVIANRDFIISQGGGQTSRIDAAKIALEKAKKKGFNKNLILASDAFFPFDDNIILANEYGVETIIQPGGSIKDKEVIAKADELEISMAFTSTRHFKH